MKCHLNIISGTCHFHLTVDDRKYKNYDAVSCNVVSNSEMLCVTTEENKSFYLKADNIIVPLGQAHS